MCLNKVIEKSFFGTLEEELKNSKDELLRASQNFTELSQIYDKLEKNKELISPDNMMYLIGFQNPLRIIHDYYEKFLLDYGTLTDAIEMIFNDDKIETKYKNLYSCGVTFNKSLTNSPKNTKNSFFFNYGDKIIEINEIENRCTLKSLNEILMKE